MKKLQAFRDYLLKNTGLKQTIIKNSIWFSLAHLSSRLMKLILVPLTARILGPEIYGGFTYTFSLVGSVFLFSNLGIGSIFTREFHNEEKDTLYAAAFYVKFIVLCACTVVSGFLYFFVDDPLVKSIFFICVFKFMIDHIGNFFTDVIRPTQLLQHENIRVLSENATVFLFGMWILLKHPSVVNFSFVYLLGAIISFLVIIRPSLRIIPPAFTFNRARILRFFIMVSPFLGTTIIHLVLFYSDTLMLKWYMGAAAVGYYQAATKLTLVSFVICELLYRNIYPALTALKGNISRVITVTKKGLAAQLILVLPLSILIFFLAENIILSIFGADYTASIIVMKYLSFFITISFLVMYLNHVLLALHKERQNLVFSAFSAVINIILNVILIPKVGVIGAVIALIVARIVDLTFTYGLACKVLKNRLFDFQNFGVILFNNLLIGVLVWALTHTQLHFFLISVITGFTYIALLRLTKEKHFMDVLNSFKSAT